MLNIIKMLDPKEKYFKKKISSNYFESQTYLINKGKEIEVLTSSKNRHLLIDDR